MCVIVWVCLVSQSSVLGQPRFTKRKELEILIMARCKIICDP